MLIRHDNISMLNIFQRKKHQLRSRVINYQTRNRMVPLSILRRRNARRITLRVTDERINICAPNYVSDIEILNFVDSQSDWVESRLRTKYENFDKEEPSILYLGKEIPIKITPNYSGHQYFMRLQNDCFWLDRPKGAKMSPVRQVEKHLKEETKKSISVTLPPVLVKLGEPTVQISIRNQRSRWGSCSSKRHLSFNWRLIMAPKDVLRYVVIHEAAHLRYHDHSQKFWSLVEQLMPDYHQYRQWLKDNQERIMIKLDHRLANL